MIPSILPGPLNSKGSYSLESYLQIKYIVIAKVFACFDNLFLMHHVSIRRSMNSSMNGVHLCSMKAGNDLNINTPVPGRGQGFLDSVFETNIIMKTNELFK